MNDQFVKDISKSIMSEPIRQEISPGSMGRRYDPECGIRKHNERIHRDSKYADTHKNLPFTFRKSPKSLGRSTAVSCDNCGAISYGTTATVGIICSSCGKFSSVSEV